MAVPATLARVCALRGHEDRVWGLAWRPSADPPQLASCGTDQVVRLWGARAGADLALEESWILLTELESAGRHTRTLRSLSWDVNGSVLAVVSFDATTTLWQEAPRNTQGEALRFECVGVASGHENEVKSAAFSPSGDFFATCSRDKSVWIYDAADNFEYECIALLQSHTQDVKMVKWHPSQDILFSCSYDDTIKIWGPDGDDWSCKETLEAHSSTVWCISFNAEGSHFATCSDDRTIRIWAPGAAIAGQPESAGESRAPVGISAAAYVTPLFRAGSLAATGAARPPQPPASKIERKAPADASCQWHVISTIEDQHSRPVYAVDWLPSIEGGSAIASACGDNYIRIFRPVDEASLRAWSCVAAVEAHLGDVNSVAWCLRALPSGGALLASAGDDCEVALWQWSCS